MGALLIGDLAERAGVPTATIRYYESIGLLKQAPRASSGYRRYSGGVGFAQAAITCRPVFLAISAVMLMGALWTTFRREGGFFSNAFATAATLAGFVLSHARGRRHGVQRACAARVQEPYLRESVRQ